jgi:hypothetical protein
VSFQSSFFVRIQGIVPALCDAPPGLLLQRIDVCDGLLHCAEDAVIAVRRAAEQVGSRHVRCESVCFSAGSELIHRGPATVPSVAIACPCTMRGSPVSTLLTVIVLLAAVQSRSAVGVSPLAICPRSRVRDVRLRASPGRRGIMFSALRGRGRIPRCSTRIVTVAAVILHVLLVISHRLQKRTGGAVG